MNRTSFNHIVNKIAGFKDNKKLIVPQDKNYQKLRSFLSKCKQNIDTQLGKFSFSVVCEENNGYIFAPYEVLYFKQSGVYFLKNTQSALKELTTVSVDIRLQLNSWLQEANELFEKLVDANENSSKSVEDDVYKVGDIYAGTYGYSMVLAEFAKIIQVLPKSIKFAILDKKPSPNNHGDPSHYPVIPDLNKVLRVVMVRKPTNPNNGIDVKKTWMQKWDGKEIIEDHMD